MRGEGNHKIPGSFAPENMEKTGAERVKYSLACQHEDAISIKFVSYAQKCPTVLCTFAVALRKESVDRNVLLVNGGALSSCFGRIMNVLSGLKPSIRVAVLFFSRSLCAMSRLIRLLLALLICPPRGIVLHRDATLRLWACPAGSVSWKLLAMYTLEHIIRTITLYWLCRLVAGSLITLGGSGVGSWPRAMNPSCLSICECWTAPNRQ